MYFNSKNMQHQSLGFKLIFYIIIFSSIITIILVSIHLSWDYHLEIKQIKQRFNQIQDSYLEPLTTSLWVDDKEQVTLQLEGILKLPAMQYLAIYMEDQIILSAGIPGKKNIIFRKFPLFFIYNQQKISIGTLYAEATLEDVYQGIYRHVFIILCTESIKIFLTAAFFIYLFYHLAGKHLYTITSYASSMDLKNLNHSLSLDRSKHKSGKKDDLDILVSSINNMKEGLRLSILDMRQTNEILENEITERVEAEENLKIYQNKLEEIVEMRTKELKQSNKQLVREIEERKKAEARLKIFHYFAENSGQGCGWTNLDGTIAYVNPSLCKMMGAKKYDLKGKNFTDFYDENHQNILKKDILPKVLKGETWTGELKLISLDGKEIPTLENIFLIHDSENNPLYIADLITDMTERLHIEKQLVKAKKMEATAILAGGIAHDFNNLLTIISGYVEMAKDSISSEHSIIKMLNEAASTAEKAGELTRKFISFSQAKTLVKTNICISKLLQACVENQINSNIQYNLSIPDNILPVKVDQEQLKQALCNIIINAKESMPQGGTIQIIANNVNISPDKTYFPIKLNTGNYIKIQIKDQGCGIHQKILPNVLDPYFSTKERGVQKGMGLGLTIVHAIIKKHEGDIYIESAPDMGTTVTFYLPAYEN